MERESPTPIENEIQREGAREREREATREREVWGGGGLRERARAVWTEVLSN